MRAFAAPVCVVSTHLDDAVLSCGYALDASPDATVVTVFAGLPEGPAGQWDATTTGEETAEAAVAARRAEDVRALGLLGARAVWLDLLDQQYDGAPHTERVAQVQEALRPHLTALSPVTVLAPLGMTHPDHVAVGQACVLLARESEAAWWAYEDVPYAQSRGLVAAARRRVLRIPDTRRTALAAARRHVGLGRPVLVRGDAERKSAAVDCYASQLAALRDSADRYAAAVVRPEVYRRVQT